MNLEKTWRKMKSFLRILFVLCAIEISYNELSAKTHSLYKSKLGTLFKNVTKLREKRSELEKEGFFMNTWAVELHEPAEEDDLRRIAKKHGFTVLGKVCALSLFIMFQICMYYYVWFIDRKITKTMYRNALLYKQ